MEKKTKNIVGQRFLEDLVLEADPRLEERPEAWARAAAAIVRPSLEALVLAYREACGTPIGREAARLFLTNMLAAES